MKIFEVNKNAIIQKTPLIDKRDFIIEKIPNFYLDVFQNSDDVCEFLNEQDLILLEHCLSIKIIV